MGIDGPLRARIVPLESIGGNYQDVRHRVPDLDEGRAPARLRAAGRRSRRACERTLAWHRALREDARGGVGSRERRAGSPSPRRRAGRRRPLLAAGRPARRRADDASARSPRACWPTRSTCSRRASLGPEALRRRRRAVGRACSCSPCCCSGRSSRRVSRAVADHLARGEDARPAVRSAGLADRRRSRWPPSPACLRGVGAADRRPVRRRARADRRADRRRSPATRSPTSRAASPAACAGSAATASCCSPTAAIRLVVALPLLFVASPTVAAVAIAAAAVGGALAPLLSRAPRRAAALSAGARRAASSRSAAPRASRCPRP